MGETELAALATDQEGLVTRSQARDHLSREQLLHRIQHRRLEPIRWGVYRFAGVPPTRWQPLRSALLAAGVGAVASHRSAAEVWSIDGVVAEMPELTVPWPLWARIPGVRCHQSSRLLPAHLTRRDGVPVTTPARTLADLSSVFEAPMLGQLVDQSLRRGVLRLEELRAAHDVLTGRGRRRLTVLRRVLSERVPGYDPGGSSPEVDVLKILVAAGLPRPVQQHQVCTGGTVYLLDLAYPELRVGIEYNGWESHGTRSAVDHDARRRTALTLAGWTVLEFTSATGAGAIVDSVSAARERALREEGVHDPKLREKIGG